MEATQLANLAAVAQQEPQLVMTAVIQGKILLDALMIEALLIIAVQDIKYLKISNKNSYSLLLAGISINLIWGNGIGAIFWGLACGGLMLFIGLVSSGGLGGGDVKLTAAIAAYLGDWRGLVLIITAFWLGGLLAVYLMYFRKHRCSGNMKLPFAPFLTAGGIVAIIGGSEIIQWISVGW